MCDGQQVVGGRKEVACWRQRSWYVGEGQEPDVLEGVEEPLGGLWRAEGRHLPPPLPSRRARETEDASQLEAQGWYRRRPRILPTNRLQSPP